MSTFNIVRSGMNASMHQIGLISDNVSNASTTAFKRSDASFEDVFGKAAGRPDVDLGMGTRLVGNRRAFSQGPLTETGGALDVALDGPGMFVLGTEPGSPGPIFTRDGSFQMRADGTIVAGDGRPVLDVALQPIRIPPTDVEGRLLSGISVDAGGRVLVAYGVGSQEPVAQLAVALFDKPERLAPLGRAQFLANDAGLLGVGPAGRIGVGRAVGGHLELANTDMTGELTGLLRAQQAFGAMSRMMQAEVDATESFLR